jgi:coenzyme F420 hydrogenase subunit beta
VFALEQGFAGVVHIGSDDAAPWRNRTHVSRTKLEVEQRAGSRYSPASPGEGLAAVDAADAPYLFVGKPCDVAGAQMARAIRPGIDRNLGLTIAIFCAGTPNLRGTLEMLGAMGVSDPADVTSLRYRGHGWPGDANVETAGGPAPRSLTYDESWGAILQRHRPWRCSICPDHSGEFADISIGDPWYRPTAGDPGRSLVVARTERGERFVRAAIESGVITVEVSPHVHLPQSQPNLLKVRGRVWGRLMGMRLMGMPTPDYRNIHMLHSWLWVLSFREKAASVIGAIRRIRARGLARPRPVQPFEIKDTP